MVAGVMPCPRQSRQVRKRPSANRRMPLPPQRRHVDTLVVLAGGAWGRGADMGPQMVLIYTLCRARPPETAVETESFLKPRGVRRSPERLLQQGGLAPHLQQQFCRAEARALGHEPRAGSQEADHRRAIQPTGALRRQALGGHPLAQPIPLPITQQGNVAVARRREAQCLANRHLGSRGGPQVCTAHHIADAKGEFVHGGGQVIGHHAIGPSEHHIPHLPRPIQTAGRAKALLPVQGPRRQPQAPAGPAPLSLPPEGLLELAGAWIGREAAVGGGDVRQESAAAMAGIQRTRAAQGRQHGGVDGPSLALEDHGAVPMEPQPLQVREDGCLGSRPHPGPVEIIEPEQPAALEATGVQPAQQGRAQVAEMESPAGGGGKTAGDTPLAQAQALRKAFVQEIETHDKTHPSKSGPSRPPNCCGKGENSQP